jgi:hypothetical protein
MKFISFSGAKQSGKTTGFNVIKENFNGVVELSMADRLKVVCSQVFELPLNFMHDEKLKEKELKEPIFLLDNTIEACILLFDKKPGIDYTYNEHIRPHIGMIFHTPRKLLQYIGTDVLRKVDTDIHINYAANNVDKSAKVCVIPDIRFSNEFDYFYSKFPKDFYPFYVNNKKAENIGNLDGHSSEQEYKKFKHLCTELDNNTSIEAYKKLVNKSVSEIL